MTTHRAPPDTLVELARVVASLQYDEFLRAAELAGIDQPADLLGRAHIIAGVADDAMRREFAHSALERDADNGLAYEFARGDVVFITVRDPTEPSRGFTFSLTLSGREYPNMDVWAFGVSPASGEEVEEEDEEPLYRLSLSFLDLDDFAEDHGPLRAVPQRTKK
jgi:hypothetical protein